MRNFFAHGKLLKRAAAGAIIGAAITGGIAGFQPTPKPEIPQPVAELVTTADHVVATVNNRDLNTFQRVGRLFTPARRPRAQTERMVQQGVDAAHTAKHVMKIGQAALDGGKLGGIAALSLAGAAGLGATMRQHRKTNRRLGKLEAMARKGKPKEARLRALLHVQERHEFENHRMTPSQIERTEVLTGPFKHGRLGSYIQEQIVDAAFQRFGKHPGSKKPREKTRRRKKRRSK
jgi:hypothetical protein